MCYVQIFRTRGGSMEMFDALDRAIKTRRSSASCLKLAFASTADSRRHRGRANATATSQLTEPRSRNHRGHRRHRAAPRRKPAGHAGGGDRAECRRAREAADRQHHRSRQGGAEHPVPFLRNADRQQLRGAGVHSRHRADRRHAGGRPWRRRVHRRCLHGPRGGRGHGIPRHRQRADPARPARNLVWSSRAARTAPALPAPTTT